MSDGQIDARRNGSRRDYSTDWPDKVSIVLVKKRDLRSIVSSQDIEPKMRFLCWLVTPDDERFPSSQAKLAELIGVDQATLSRWKQEPDFVELVAEAARKVAAEYAGNVMRKLLERAMSGNTHAMELFFKYVMKLGDSEAANVNNNYFERAVINVGGRRAESLPVGLLKASA